MKIREVTLKYLLLTNKEYEIDMGYPIGSYTTKDIIEINKNLFNLYLLEQSQYTRIIDENITEQLRLFNINHYDNMTVATLKDFYRIEIPGDTFEEAMNKIKSTSS